MSDKLRTSVSASVAGWSALTGLDEGSDFCSRAEGEVVLATDVGGEAESLLVARRHN